VGIPIQQELLFKVESKDIGNKALQSAFREFNLPKRVLKIGAMRLMPK
jgi:hypothetical protein